MFFKMNFDFKKINKCQFFCLTSNSSANDNNLDWNLKDLENVVQVPKNGNKCLKLRLTFMLLQTSEHHFRFLCFCQLNSYFCMHISSPTSELRHIDYYEYLLTPDTFLFVLFDSQPSILRHFSRFFNFFYLCW